MFVRYTMALEQTVLVYGFGSVLAASALLAIALHHYSSKDDSQFARADSRIRHAKSLLDEADRMVVSMRRDMRGKVSVHSAESKISKAIAELLMAMEEEKKATSSAAHAKGRKK